MIGAVTSPTRRLAPWLLFAATLLSALPLGAIVAASLPASPGDCEGIGFGCSLHGWNAAKFALLVLGIPYALALFVLLSLLSLGRSPGWLIAQTVVALTGLAVPWAAVTWWVATTH